MLGTVVVAQLTARWLPIPEDPGSNPGIGKLYLTYLVLNVCRKYENKQKVVANGQFKNIWGAFYNPTFR